jgi:hypothetical protein
LTVSRCRFPAGLLAVALLAPAACSLEEITVVDVEDVVVAEVYVNLDPDSTVSRVWAYLHRTVGTGSSGDELAGAAIRVSRPDGLTLALRDTLMDLCVALGPETPAGACFVADSADVVRLRPGDVLELEVDLPDGGTLSSGTQVPASFDLEGVAPVCRLAPDAIMPLSWSVARGAWSYLNQASIRGLPTALAAEGIEFDQDPFFLLGLAISETDTTTAFPSEFGLFDRFSLDADVSLRLQRGLPEGVEAEVSISAVDANYVNWVRGGNFNPSGQVRVPSVRGDGTGVFASSVIRRFEVSVTDDTAAGLPDCPTE